MIKIKTIIGSFNISYYNKNCHFFTIPIQKKNYQFQLLIENDNVSCFRIRYLGFDPHLN